MPNLTVPALISTMLLKFPSLLGKERSPSPNVITLTEQAHYLHVVNVITIPERQEKAICKTKYQLPYKSNKEELGKIYEIESLVTM